jgi:hypothetical protein
MDLYHYFDKRTGPFKSLTMLPEDQARTVLEKVKNERPDSFCARRNDSYITNRRNCEIKVREAFAAKGGVIELDSPYYMIIGHSPWLCSWYEQPDFLKIPAEEFDVRTLSFTYGDSMPTFAVNDGKEYRQQVYTYEEISGLIDKYGLPQDWNSDGSKGPERYIEVHVWSDKVIRRYL